MRGAAIWTVCSLSLCVQADAQGTHQKALDLLAKAKYVSFTVRSSTANVALPEPTVEQPFVVGKMLLAKDGRWLWEREDGWSFLFDGRQTWRTASGTTWFEPVELRSLSGGLIDASALKANLIGIEVFLNGRWKDMPGLQNWVAAGSTDEDGKRMLLVGRPKSAGRARAVREGDPTAGYFLQFDAQTLTPTHGWEMSSSSYDRTEVHVQYSDFRYDPVDAEARLRRP